MKKDKYRLLSFAFCSAYFFLTGFCFANSELPQVCHLNDCVEVEAVSKQDDMERGLMYRAALDQNKGMLFLFTFDDKHQFWMKNMHFNLDLLWISLDGHIVYISPNTPACTSDPCPVYTPSQSGRYVLELNSGFTSAHHWKLGDKLDLKGILEK